MENNHRSDTIPTPIYNTISKFSSIFQGVRYLTVGTFATAKFGNISNVFQQDNRYLCCDIVIMES